MPKAIPNPRASKDIIRKMGMTAKNILPGKLPVNFKKITNSPKIIAKLIQALKTKIMGKHIFGK
jgi:hypothetical protein